MGKATQGRGGKEESKRPDYRMGLTRCPDQDVVTRHARYRMDQTLDSGEVITHGLGFSARLLTSALGPCTVGAHFSGQCPGNETGTPG